MYAWHNSTDFRPSTSALAAALLAKCMAIGYTSGFSEYRNATAQTICGMQPISTRGLSEERMEVDKPTVNKSGDREKVNAAVYNLGSSNETKG
jgi:hypothetical protein